MTRSSNKTKKVQRGLGRGLSTLLGDAEARDLLQEHPISNKKNNLSKNKPSNTNSTKVKNIPIEWITSGPWQPRRNFDTTQLEELAKSLLKQGVIQPVLVRSTPDQENKYELIAGERRWRAAQIAKIYEIPAIVREFSEQEAAEIALVENIQRRDLSSIEEALAYQQLIQTFGYTQQTLSTVIGKSRPHIANLLRLLTLPEWVQSALEKGTVSVGQIRPIIGHVDIDKLAELIIKQNLTAREVEKLLKPKNKINKKLQIQNENSDVENRKLEEKIEQQIGLKANINWNSKTETGSIRLSVSSVEQFDSILERLGIQTR